MKAIALMSGGLDSRLAAKLVLDQGVEVHALHFTSLFAPGGERQARSAAEQFRIPLTVENVTDELLALVRTPRYGHGSGVNPCIDCRIMELRRARRHLEPLAASFFITGEVLGQRPMSQRKDTMKLIERQAGLEGLVLRPLCALALEPSIPELEGWVDRQKLLGITGRRRVEQMRLAAALGITDYPSPAGGCRLTEPNYAARMRDLLGHDELIVDNVLLLEVGRHFRLGPSAKLVVGRIEEENGRIQELIRDGDYLLDALGVSGPLSLARGAFDEDLLRLAARITVRYGKGRSLSEVPVQVTGPASFTFTVPPAQDEELEPLRV